MSTATVSGLMTVEEFLALPDTGIERILINGELREFSENALTLFS